MYSDKLLHKQPTLITFVNNAVDLIMSIYICNILLGYICNYMNSLGFSTTLRPSSKYVKNSMHYVQYD